MSEEISASMAEPVRNIGFKRVEVLHDQVIGMGAYGKYVGQNVTASFVPLKFYIQHRYVQNLREIQ